MYKQAAPIRIRNWFQEKKNKIISDVFAVCLQVFLADFSLFC